MSNLKNHSSANYHDKKSLGNLGEKIALNYFLERGYSLLDKNFKINHLEIDLILKKGQQTIFVEVKTRTKNQASQIENPLKPLQAISLTKALIKYCLAYKINLDFTQLDLIIVLVNSQNKHADLQHYPNILA